MPLNWTVVLEVLVVLEPSSNVPKNYVAFLVESLTKGGGVITLGEVVAPEVAFDSSSNAIDNSLR